TRSCAWAPSAQAARGEAANSLKCSSPSSRAGGRSRRTYHRPRRALGRSQPRGTLTANTTTASTRPPGPLTAGRTAQADLVGACSQTTGSRPRLLAVSRPRRRMLSRLRAGVACRKVTIRRLLQLGVSHGPAVLLAPPAQLLIVIRY